MCVYACAYARERAGRADWIKVLGSLEALEALEALESLGNLESLENSQRVKSVAIEEILCVAQWRKAEHTWRM